MEPTAGEMMIDGRESSQTPYLLERSMFESPASILVYLLRFLASSGPSVLFLVRSGLLNYVAATLLMFFFRNFFQASLRRALRPGVRGLPQFVKGTSA